MQFFKSIFLLAAAGFAAAQNQITFMSQDEISRTIYFTASNNGAAVPPIRVEGWGKVTVNIPYHWIGNYYAIADGQPNIPGMLGEVAFQAYEGKTFFDVSAIVKADDHNGVKLMWPASSKHPVSGCEKFPCTNAYYLPNDVQTKVTPETHLFTILGGSGPQKRSHKKRGSNYPHDMVLGKH